MCGFLGYISDNNIQLLQNLLKLINHRGPDGIGLYYCNKNNLNLAHCRLSVLDIDNGKQPMQNLDGSLCVVFNGEIYNYKNIKEELDKHGYIFKSNSDTEVLIASYQQWGLDFIYKLNGMFSICIYDKNRNRIILARDRYGEKPLYYSLLKNSIIFSSELSPIRSFLNPKISLQSLKKYFAYGFFPQPLTQFEEVYKLEPGFISIYDIKSKKFIKSKYYEYSTNNSNKFPITEVGNKIKSLLGESILSRLNSDRNLGYSFSGGLDSSIIVSMAKNYTDNIDAYSIGFEDKSYDDSRIIIDTSNFLNLSLNLSFLDEININNSVEYICNKIDEPFSDTSLVPSYFLSKLQSKDKIVIIGGDGSDEIFYGYSTFNALFYSSILNKLPNNIFHLIKNLSTNINPTNQYMSIGYKLSKLLMIKDYPESVWNPMWLSLLNPNEINMLFGSNLKFDDLYSEAIDEWEKSSSTIYGKTSEFYVKFFLPNMILAKIDRAWMWNGLEYRSPFLDYDLVDYVSSINESYKMGSYKNKRLLKEIFSYKLPDFVLKNKKKGFNFPITKWLKKTNNVSDIMNIDSLLDKKIKLHLNSKEDNRNLLWSLKLLKRQKII